MNTFDLSPLFRSAIGFDRVASMLDSATRNSQSQPSYPPYNIELIGDDEYRITMAVAGFSEDELNIETQEGRLTITGQKADEEEAGEFLHRGIAARSFERRFQLADYVKVASADLKNGMLNVDLVREIPEAMRTRTISIGSNEPSKLLKGKAKKAGVEKAA